MKYKEIYNLVNEGTVCPSQWHAKTIDGIPLYIRYRYGYLTVTEWFYDKEKRNEIFGTEYGGKYDGYLEDEMMLKLTGLNLVEVQ